MDMDQIRADVIERFKNTARAIERVRTAKDELITAEAPARDGLRPGSSFDSPIAVSSLATLTEMVESKLMCENRHNVTQYARLVARDVIAPVARESNEPVAWLTGNSMIPPLRQVDSANVIWREDITGEMWETFVEAIESALDEQQIYMAAPEYDNALYVVDLKRWEHMDDVDAFDLNTEWKER